MSITTVYRTVYCLKQKGFLHITVQCVRMAVQGQYAFSDRIDTQLTLAALDMAYRRRTPPKSLIFHSDRGVQYADRAYREACRPMAPARVCPAKQTPMTTRWPKISSAASNANSSICSTILPELLIYSVFSGRIQNDWGVHSNSNACHSHKTLVREKNSFYDSIITMVQVSP